MAVSSSTCCGTVNSRWFPSKKKEPMKMTVPPGKVRTLSLVSSQENLLISTTSEVGNTQMKVGKDFRVAPIVRRRRTLRKAIRCVDGSICSADPARRLLGLSPRLPAPYGGSGTGAGKLARSSSCMRSRMGACGHKTVPQQYRMGNRRNGHGDDSIESLVSVLVGQPLGDLDRKSLGSGGTGATVSVTSSTLPG